MTGWRRSKSPGYPEDPEHSAESAERIRLQHRDGDLMVTKALFRQPILREPAK